MRQLVILILALFTFAGMAQDRTVTKMLDKDATYFKYTGVAADTLGNTDQDTVDVVFQVRVNGFIRKVEVKSRFDLVSGADTTVAISVGGKNFTDDSYTSIIGSTLTDDINADNTVKVVTASHTLGIAAFDVPFTNPTAGTADTLAYPAMTITPADYSYRFIRVRYIIQGESAAGTGVKIDEIELKLTL